MQIAAHGEPGAGAMGDGRFCPLNGGESMDYPLSRRRLGLARLRRLDGDFIWLVPGQCLIGRSRACQLRLREHEVSGAHALLCWRNGVWEIKDLGSRNGTYVDGARLGEGLRVCVPAGTMLGFGRRDGFELIDADPPSLHAVAVGAEERVVLAVGGLLSLPHADSPELMILHCNEGWRLETADGLASVADGEVVGSSEGSWRVHLPEQLTPTRDAKDAVLTLGSVKLEFCVDAAQKLAAFTAVRGDRSVEFKLRAHDRTLLALARVRLHDTTVAPHVRGWIHQNMLIDRLGFDAGRLHVEIHRIRRQFAKAGIVDAVHIVERRRDTNELRIGVADLKIHNVAG